MYNSSTEEQNFKQAVRDINPRMAQTVNLGCETQLKETRFGESPVGSYASYQHSHTEFNFSVCVDTSSVPREKNNNQALTHPLFPLGENEEPVVQKTLSVPERKLFESQCIDEETVNSIEKETRDHNLKVWQLERKYRFTASQFYWIFHRQRNHDKFAHDIMCPKTFQSRHTAHGIKWEPEAIDKYHKYMHSQKTPLRVSKVDLL